MKRLFSFPVVLVLVSAPAFVQTGSVAAAKDFDLVVKSEPLPARLQAGYDSIQARDLKSLLTFLASDQLEGRETAGRGYDTACEYAASLFALWGLKPAGDFERPARVSRGGPGLPDANQAVERTYFQRFEMKETTNSDSRFTVDTSAAGVARAVSFTANVDYLYTPLESGSLQAPLVFAGYGISDKEIGYDDYAGLNVRGKAVMLLADAPGRDNPRSPFQQEKVRGRYFPAPQMSMGRPGGVYNKISAAEKLGAVVVLLVRSSLQKEGDVAQTVLDRQRSDDEQAVIPGENERRHLALIKSGERMPWDSLPTVTISHEMANRILAGSGRTVAELIERIEKTGEPDSFAMPGSVMRLETTAKTGLVRSQNVLGRIEGSDPKLKDEVVVVGAHLDHLGRRGDYIFNGADDNGSGSAAVLALARALAQNPQKPSRSVLFALWTGEEQGLLGSRFYVDHPFMPLAKTVNINIDMLSRGLDEKTMRLMARMFNLDVSGELFKKLRLDRFMSVSYSDGGFETLLRAANRWAGLDLHLRPSQPGRMNRVSGSSDHASFAFRNAPWVSFIASMHDDFHRPSDTVDKINFAYFERMTRYVYLTLWQMADRPVAVTPAN